MADPEASYSLGPISAGANSPLGGFFGFISGLSNNYATGLNAAVLAPTASAHILTGGQVTTSDVTALRTAEATGLSGNPFVQLGQIFGGLTGSGVTAVGTTVGVTGTVASPGIAVGAGSAVTGITSAASAGVTGAASGILPGLSNGIGAGLTNAGIGIKGALQGAGGAPGSGLGGAFGNSFFLVAAGLILILVFFAVK